ncbi:MAG: methyltransferase domain-containing protein [Rhizobiaceae bacterium]
MPEILIEKLGSAGDGIGRNDGRPVYVSNTLPGERVRTDDDLPNPSLQEVLEPSAERREPPCPHFGECGGCTFQHASQELILDWKRQEVDLAFSQTGLVASADPTIASPIAARRRVTFTANRSGTGTEDTANSAISLGYKQRRSEALVNIETCAILHPALESEIGMLRDLCKTLLRGNEEIQIAINLCDNGLDLAFDLPQMPNETMIAGFVRAFAKTAYLRASINGDVVVEKEKPLVSFGKAQVAIPSGGFLQAVADAEKAMAELVTKHLGGRKRVIDLFSGSGTFSLRLAERSRVHAVEMEGPALEALRSASSAEGLKSVTIEERDLHELPLTSSELKPFDGLCLDPPRAGAEAQCKLIAASNIRAVAYISCNPGSLARDAAHLVNGGYTLERLVPIDQFVFSPHIEVVALFTKKPSKAARSIFR